jgi:hypothetical protein
MQVMVEMAEVHLLFHLQEHQQVVEVDLVQQVVDLVATEAH